ncbi:hypothetical protein [Lichenicoccus sp.]|uniref:hypothetical protein n=1 Tax=Lichenicoccus sp. TaxID=2781899 RepID=UPI003D09EA9F
MSQPTPLPGPRLGPHPAPQPGMYAWDERDARSIASNTPTYSSSLFIMHQSPAPVETRTRAGHSAPARLASAVMARLRSRRRASPLCG